MAKKPKVNCKKKQNIHLTACRNRYGQFTSRGKGYSEAMQGGSKRKASKKKATKRGLPKPAAKYNCKGPAKWSSKMKRCVCKTGAGKRQTTIPTKHCKRK